MDETELNKLKPGDVVKVKQNLIPYENFGRYCVIPHMLVKRVTMTEFVSEIGWSDFGIHVKENNCVYTCGMLNKKSIIFGR